MPDPSTPLVSKTMYWVSWIVSAPPVLLLLMSAGMKLAKPDFILKGFAQQGYPEYVIQPLGFIELACTVLYLIPQTSVLGAILVTGYLGGATATHVRVGEIANAFAPVAFGALVWLGLLMREPRLRPLLPLRK